MQIGHRNTLRIFLAGAFVAEPITYNVGVGPSSRELPLSGTFAITP